MGDVDNVDSLINKPLEEFKDIIKEGIEYIYTTPHKWVEVVSFDGLKLKARYYDNKSDKTIILFHGYRSAAARDFSCAVKMYIDFGFNLLLCDQRSHGRSEGRLITFGVKESCDVITWTEFVQSKFKPTSIILDGMSMGAPTVLLSANHNLPPVVKGIIADCGFSSPVDIINKVAKDSFKINAKYLLPFLDLGCKLFGKFSIYGSSTLDSVKKFDRPILFVHGRKDGFVPCEMSEMAYSNANEESKLVIIEDANHGLSFLVDRKTVEKELKIFLEKCIES